MKKILESKVTKRPLQDGFLNIPAKYIDSFPNTTSTTPVRVYFDSANDVRRISFLPKQRRLTGLTGWYRQNGAKTGDTISIEVISRGKYRMRLVPGQRLGVNAGRSRHDRVVQILYGLCKPLYKEAYADHINDSNYRIIPIHSGYKLETPEIYQYRPDLWCKSRNGKVDIIEVWDTQSKEASGIDILFSALIPDAASLSIVCFDEETRNLARKLSKVILTSIFNQSGEALLSHQEVLPYIVLIPKDIQHDVDEVREFLRDKLNLSKD